MESGISYRADKTFDRKGLLELYEDVGWTAYTDEPERLERAIAQSAHVVSAWDGDRLVGLARVVSDGEHVDAGLGFEMASRIGMSAFMRLKPRRSSP